MKVKANHVLIACCVSVLAWIGFNDGLWYLFKYVVFLSCVVSNGIFVASILQLKEKKLNIKIIGILVMTLVTNLLAAYFAYPKLLLVAALWIPAIMGYLYSKIA